MDLTKINLDEYDLVDITNIEYLKEEMPYIDITVDEDHTLYIYDGKNFILQKQCDGSHIAGLYIGFFYKYANSIIKNKQLCRLKTPIVCLKDKNENIVKMFFDLNEYKEYEKNNNNDKLTPHYYKGLGSWKPKDLKELIKKFGLEYFIEVLEYDENTNLIIHSWLDSKEADARKDFLRNYNINLNKV